VSKKADVNSRSAVLAREAVKGLDPAKTAEAEAEARADVALNPSQKKALEASLRQRCTIVQGPPGTGKTHVSVRILSLWAKTMGRTPLLATSDSNVAVDNIAEGLSRLGVKVVRVGRVEKVRGHLEELTLECMLDRHKEEEALKKEEEKILKEEEEALRKEEEALTKDAEIMSDEEFDCMPSDDEEEALPPETQEKDKEENRPLTAQQQITRDHAQKSKQRREDFEARMKIMQGMEVICATTIAAGSDFLSRFHFKGVLIDEVAQATETSSIVPVVLRGANQLVLVGDNCQLPPSVMSREAELRGLSLSIYSRLVNTGLEPNFLDTQYRSHPKIAEFSAKCFYHNRIRSGITASSRPPPAGVAWPNPACPVAFMEIGEDETIEGESKANHAEAEMVKQIVFNVLAEGELGPEDIGVVTPYMAQVRLLRRMIRDSLPPNDRKLLEIASVDNFQGREKELIIFSAVRCNPRGNMGFLADWRRLNVMLTRARRGLLVLGAAQTLRHDPHWSEWLAWCHKHGATISRRQKRPIGRAVLRNGQMRASKGKGKYLSAGSFSMRAKASVAATTLKGSNTRASLRAPITSGKGGVRGPLGKPSSRNRTPWAASPAQLSAAAQFAAKGAAPWATDKASTEAPWSVEGQGMEPLQNPRRKVWDGATPATSRRRPRPKGKARPSSSEIRPWPLHRTAIQAKARPTQRGPAKPKPSMSRPSSSRPETPAPWHVASP